MLPYSFSFVFLPRRHKARYPLNTHVKPLLLRWTMWPHGPLVSCYFYMFYMSYFMNFLKISFLTCVNFKLDSFDKGLHIPGLWVFERKIINHSTILVFYTLYSLYIPAGKVSELIFVHLYKLGSFLCSVQLIQIRCFEKKP